MHSPACDDPGCLVPDGACHCGCGLPTQPAKKTERLKRRVEGAPHLYRRGHNGSPGARKPKPIRYVTDENGCWIWQLSVDRDGYGQFGREGRFFAAHRFYYEQHRGPIPDGLQIDHLCRVRNCVNPDHMEAVTFAENIRRRELARSSTR